MSLDPAGLRLYVTGVSAGVWTGADYATVAFDTPTGAQLWASRHDSPSGEPEVASSISVHPDGSAVFVAGASGEGSIEYVTVAYDTVASCRSGFSEEGTLSSPVHETMEPMAGPLGRTVHQANCDVLVPAGL